MNNNNSKRIVYLDYLRIISCFLVVMVHVSAQFVTLYDTKSLSFAVSLTYDFIGLIGVPLFVMISGALTLRHGYTASLKSVLLRKTLHYFIIYYIWKALYQLYTLYSSGNTISAYAIKNDVILALIQKNGYYHLWFLPMLAIIYMFYPVIKKGLENNKELCIYFIAVFFISEVLFPTLFNYEFKFKYLFVDFFNQNSFYMFGGYLGYFVLGHLLNTWCDISNIFKRTMFVVIGICSVIAGGALGTVASAANGEPSYIMNTPFSIPSFLVACSIFVITKSIISANPKVTSLAEATLGIYLIHPLIINILPEFIFNIGKVFPLISIPVITLLIAAICFVLTKIILHIPIIKSLVN